MGTVPGAIRKGGLVCLLFGRCVPFIPRPTDIENIYKFVWEGNVHGIMKGEVVNLWRQEGIAKSCFTFC